MRPHQELSEKFKVKRDEIVGRFVRKPIDSEHFNNQVSTMLSNITGYLTNHRGNPEDIKNQTDNNRRFWTEDLNKVRTHYGALYSVYTNLIEEENIINRIETRAQIRALIFRFLTTIAIGAGVMLTYYLAHKWGMPMPLSRSLTSGL